MGTSRLALQAAFVGGMAGGLAEVLVLRLNPEIPTPTVTLLLQAVLWSSWGAATVGSVLLVVLLLLRRLRGQGARPDWWPLPTLATVVFAGAAGLTLTNSDIHADFLSGSGHRTLDQDAVTWLIGALLAMAAGAWVRRVGSPVTLRLALALSLLALPVVRIASQPSPPLAHLEQTARPLGQPARQLLVIGLEGLDSNLLLSHIADGRFPALSRLAATAAWGPLAPHRPYLRRSLWTTAATGTNPRAHGVKSGWAWRVPGLLQPVRLLPWLPGGSRLALPWLAARRELPPPALVPALWERLQVSGVSTVVLGWPGQWRELPPGPTAQPDPAASLLEPGYRASLESSLERTPEARQAILEAMATDLTRTATARAELAAGTGALFLHLGTLAVARAEAEPQEAYDTNERAALDLVLEQVDDELAALLDAAPRQALVAVVSPYGMEPPGPEERLLRLLGLGGTWHATARSCPAGVLLLLGEGVAGPSRFPSAGLADVVPTMCYLLGLPVAQYMEGHVSLDAVEPGFLARNPLRVVY